MNIIDRTHARAMLDARINTEPIDDGQGRSYALWSAPAQRTDTPDTFGPRLPRELKRDAQ